MRTLEGWGGEERRGRMNLKHMLNVNVKCLLTMLNKILDVGI